MMGNVIFANGCGQRTGRVLFVYSDAEFEMFGKTLREKYHNGLADKYECF